MLNCKKGLDLSVKHDGISKCSRLVTLALHYLEEFDVILLDTWGGHAQDDMYIPHTQFMKDPYSKSVHNPTLKAARHGAYSLACVSQDGL